MKRRVKLAGALLLALAALWGLAASVAADDAYSPRTLAIARQLNCPVCSGESVADSQAEVAHQMRDSIEQQVQAGKSDAEIKQYFVERYGESVLASPPKSGFTLALWWIPVLGLAIGALALGLFLRERTRVPDVPDPAPARDDELERIAREVLGGPDGGAPAGATRR